MIKIVNVMGQIYRRPGIKWEFSTISSNYNICGDVVAKRMAPTNAMHLYSPSFLSMSCSEKENGNRVHLEEYVQLLIYILSS